MSFVLATVGYQSHGSLLGSSSGIVVGPPHVGETMTRCPVRVNDPTAQRSLAPHPGTDRHRYDARHRHARLPAPDCAQQVCAQPRARRSTRGPSPTGPDRLARRIYHADSADILDRRTLRFVLWSPGRRLDADPGDRGQLVPGTATLQSLGLGEFPLTPVAWPRQASGTSRRRRVRPPSGPSTTTGSRSTTAARRNAPRAGGRHRSVLLLCRLAGLPAERRLLAACLRGPLEIGGLEDATPNGDTAVFSAPTPATLPPNNRLVIYELPTAWTMSAAFSQPERGAATFADVAALVDTSASAARTSPSWTCSAGDRLPRGAWHQRPRAAAPGRQLVQARVGLRHLPLPARPTRARLPRGQPLAHAEPRSGPLVKRCHSQGIRFFADMVMAFAPRGAVQPHRRTDFCIDNPCNAGPTRTRWTSTRCGGHELADGFGSTLWRYARFRRRPTTRCPGRGRATFSRARQLMLA